MAESNGDRRDAPNYLVLITDGRSNNRSLTWQEAIAARAQGITILVVSSTLMAAVVVSLAEYNVAKVNSKITNNSRVSKQMIIYPRFTFTKIFMFYCTLGDLSNFTSV